MSNLPKVGEVWGILDKPKTWRIVVRVTKYRISYEMFDDSSWCEMRQWDEWLALNGFQRIFPPIQVTTGPWPQQNWMQIT